MERAERSDHVQQRNRAPCSPPRVSGHAKTSTPDAQISAVNLVDLQKSSLERQNQELLYINMEWAEQFRVMKQHYEQRLLAVKRQSETESRLTEPGEEKEGRRRGGKEEDKSSSQTEHFAELAGLREYNSELAVMLEKSEKEVKRLRERCQTLARRGQHKDSEIGRLNKTLQEVQESRRVKREEVQQQEQVWRHQAELYKEDFLKEKRDRESLMGKHGDLEKRFRKVSRELDMIRREVQSPTQAACLWDHHGHQPV